MKKFWTALGFLTIFPLPKGEGEGFEELGRAALWFPLVGALIGVIVALALFGFELFLPPLLSAVLSTAVWVGLTGGLHLDGLADCCDGMLTPLRGVNASAPERRLEIMKDPHVGAFGVLGLILAVTLKISALSSLPISMAWVAIPLAASVARWLLLWIAPQPMARQGGMGVSFTEGIQPIDVVLAALIPLGLIFVGGVRAVIAVLLACLVTLGIVRLARARLGGLTGDVFGLTVELTELTILLAFVA